MSKEEQLHSALSGWRAFKVDLETRILHRESLLRPSNSFLKDTTALRNQWELCQRVIESLELELNTGIAHCACHRPPHKIATL
jgi:hypothetical protein